MTDNNYRIHKHGYVRVHDLHIICILFHPKKLIYLGKTLLYDYSFVVNMAVKTPAE